MVESSVQRQGVGTRPSKKVWLPRFEVLLAAVASVIACLFFLGFGVRFFSALNHKKFRIYVVGEHHRVARVLDAMGATNLRCRVTNSNQTCLTLNVGGEAVCFRQTEYKDHNGYPMHVFAEKSDDGEAIVAMSLGSDGEAWSDDDVLYGSINWSNRIESGGLWMHGHLSRNESYWFAGRENGVQRDEETFSGAEEATKEFLAIWLRHLSRPEDMGDA